MSHPLDHMQRLECTEEESRRIAEGIIREGTRLKAIPFRLRRGKRLFFMERTCTSPDNPLPDEDKVCAHDLMNDARCLFSGAQPDDGDQLGGG